MNKDEDLTEHSYYVFSTDINAAARAELVTAHKNWRNYKYKYDKNDPISFSEITRIQKILLDIFDHFFEPIESSKPAWSGVKWEVFCHKDGSYDPHVEFTMNSEDGDDYISIDYSLDSVKVFYTGKRKFKIARSFTTYASRKGYTGYTQYDCDKTESEYGNFENAKKLPVDKEWFPDYSNDPPEKERGWKVDYF
jgi:hypothetical protein